MHRSICRVASLCLLNCSSLVIAACASSAARAPAPPRPTQPAYVIAADSPAVPAKPRVSKGALAIRRAPTLHMQRGGPSSAKPSTA